MPRKLPYKIIKAKTRAEAISKWGYDTAYQAIQADNMEALNFLLEKWADPLKNFKGESPIMLAVRKRNFDAVKLLAQKGVLTGSRDKAGNTLLAVSVSAGDIEMTSLLLSLGAYVNTGNKEGHTPLAIAARKGDLDIMNLLLSKNAGVNVPWIYRKRTNRCSTPLHQAVMGQHLQAVKLLVEHGAALYATNEHGKTPLQVAKSIEGGNNLAKIVNYLKQKAPDADKLDAYGNTPLIHALKSKNSQQAKQLLSGIDTPQLPPSSSPAHTFPPCGAGCFGSSLRSNEEEDPQRGNDVGVDIGAGGADVNARDQLLKTPLMWATKFGNLEIVKLLVARGAQVGAKNIYNETALNYAVMHGNLAIVEFLIENGGKKYVNEIAATYRYTLLQIAAKLGYTEIAKLLIDNGANPNLRNKHGHTTPSVVVRFKKATNTLSKTYKRTARIETSGKRGFTALTYAARKGNTDMVNLLVNNNADVNARDCFGRTPLMWVSWKNSRGAKISKTLIEAGADVNARDMEGASAILFATRHGRRQIVECLLQAGADVNDLNDHGFTPLMMSAQRGSLKFTKFLLENGADVNMEEEFGRSALFFAVEGGHFMVAEFLLKNGANANVSDEYTKKTALYVAKEAGRSDIVELLRKHGATK